MESAEYLTEQFEPVEESKKNSPPCFFTSPKLKNHQQLSKKTLSTVDKRIQAFQSQQLILI